MVDYCKDGRGYLYDCKTKRDALDYSLEFCGYTTARILISYLEKQYNLIINGSTPCSALADIATALYEVAGAGAEVMIDGMHEFLHLVHKNAANTK